MLKFNALLFLLTMTGLGASCYGAGVPSPVPPHSRTMDEVSTMGLSAPSTTPVHDADWWLFDPKELHLEVTWLGLENTAAQQEEKNDAFGIGMHYFTCRYCSLGVDYMHSPGFSSEDLLFATIKARIPFDEAGLAIILLAGGGTAVGGVDSGGMNFEVGAGLELRLLDAVSLVVDYRFIGPDAEIQGLRVGLSFLL